MHTHTHTATHTARQSDEQMTKRLYGQGDGGGALPRRDGEGWRDGKRQRPLTRLWGGGWACARSDSKAKMPNTHAHTSSISKANKKEHTGVNDTPQRRPASLRSRHTTKLRVSRSCDGLPMKANKGKSSCLVASGEDSAESAAHFLLLLCRAHPRLGVESGGEKQTCARCGSGDDCPGTCQ